jgi:hypothetical protein
MLLKPHSRCGLTSVGFKLLMFVNYSESTESILFRVTRETIKTTAQTHKSK